MTKPNKWVVVKIITDEPPIYKVFATWFGGYLDGDAWKINSGITRVEKKDDIILFYGASGSCYECNSNHYGTNFYTQNVLNGIIEKAEQLGCSIEILPQETEWSSIQF